MSEEKIQKCPRCGWYDSEKPLINEDDKKEYLRSILGGRVFSKTYELYNGSITFTYQSLLGSEVEKINEVFFDLAAANEPELLIEGNKIKSLFYLKKIKIEETTTNLETPEDVSIENYKEKYLERFGKSSEPIIQMLNSTLIQFLKLQTNLVANGFDENFWKGAGQ